MNASKVSKYVSQLDKELHPLENSAVLQNVFRVSSTHDLANFRRVSKIWRDASLAEWRNCAELILLQQPTDEGSKGMKASDFLFHYSQDNFKLRSKPFKRYQLKGWSFDFSIDPRVTTQDLYKNVGSVIKHLHLHMCRSKQYIPKGFYELVFQNNLSNLQSLTLSKNVFGMQRLDLFNLFFDWEDPADKKYLDEIKPNVSVRKLKIEGPTPHHFHKFTNAAVKWFPNVEDIEAGGRDGNSFVTCVLKSAHGAGVGPNYKLPLKHLDILKCYKLGAIDSDRLLMHLPQAGFPLESLSFQFGADSELVFKPILMAYAKSLQNLKLYSKICRKPVPEFPSVQFAFLKELSLHGRIIKDFKFLQHMKKIGKLHLDLDGYEMWNGQNMTDIECRFLRIQSETPESFPLINYKVLNADIGVKLSNLRYFHMDFIFSSEQLKLFYKSVQNLKVLEIIANNEELKSISELWCELKELGLLYGSSVNDEAILTIPGSLTDLRRFSLETKCDQSKLTDGCVYGGFLQIKWLQFLDVCVSPQMSSAAEKDLKKKICTVRVVRNYGQDHNESCCRKKRYAEIFNTV